MMDIFSNWHISIHIGVPVIDGEVLAMPVLDALLEGVMDVPVMIGEQVIHDPINYTHIRYLCMDLTHT